MSLLYGRLAPKQNIAGHYGLAVSLAFHNKLLNEMKKVGHQAVSKPVHCLCVKWLKMCDVSFKWNDRQDKKKMKEDKVKPSLLMLRHDLAQVSPLAWGKGHFEGWKSNTGIWAGPLSHRGY